jgi:hypothetical protein
VVRTSIDPSTVAIAHHALAVRYEGGTGKLSPITNLDAQEHARQQPPGLYAASSASPYNDA